MTQNKLQLNEDKTEAFLVTTSSCDKEPPVSIQIRSSIVPFVKNVENFGIALDLKLCIKEQVNKVCQMAYWELRKISSARRCLTDKAAKTLVVSLVLSRLDYGSCLLAGVPDYLLHKPLKVQNASACLIVKLARREHSKPLLRELHWLPITDCIKYKLSCKWYAAVTDSNPHYLAELLQTYIPSRTLRSAADRQLVS